MKNFARATSWWLLGSVAAIVGVEIMLRVLPVPTASMSGYYVDPKILSYPAGHTWQAATGWDLRNAQRLQANQMGFPSEREFVVNRDAVALVGDSYVEASMLRADDRPGPQLERALGGARPVYAMGGPGSSLLDYAERVRLARQNLGVRDVVLLVEAGDVRQSICGSGNVHAACLDGRTLSPRVEKRPEPGLLARVARHSALAQYFVGQLRVSPASLWRATFTRQVAADEPPRPASSGPMAKGSGPSVDPRTLARAQAVVDTFLDRLRSTGPGVTVMVVDGRRHPSGSLKPELAAERHLLIQRAQQAGVRVIDAESVFAVHAQRSSRSLDVGPYDGHLNEIGVRVLMQGAAAALEGSR